ncbi:MAG: hypothetical protein KDJ19_10350 [Hyphomicrobiaceae bacterium]|nr:hypothetical protein [Hyphomicrobiaceae bacterium]
MNSTENRTSSKSIVEWLSVLGSVSSISALVAVAIGWAGNSQELPPSLTAWRFVLGFAAIVCISATLIISIISAIKTINNEGSIEKKTIVISAKILIGLLLLGIFLDGLFSAIYWVYWLSGTNTIIHYAIDVMSQFSQ